MRVRQNTNWVAAWLWAVAALVFCMVIVGGATRLTDSGLSITEWQPLLGAIPPLSEADWAGAFAKYQAIPEYQIQNRGMSLSDFQFIYWWEWSHRFLGRFIGVAFALPFLAFLVKGKIERKLWPRLVLLFILGGAQGGLGWFMVKSGLVDRLDVSQYRLAAHLSLAVLLFAAIVWTAMEVSGVRGAAARGRGMALAIVLLLFLQIAAGGFVAGLDAGHASDTWPLMNGALVPSGLFFATPWWKNLFENALTAQFDHRLLAYVLLATALVQTRLYPSRSAALLLLAMLAQAALGIITVLMQVPLAAALMHQGGALVVLATSLWHLKRLSPSPVPDQR